MKVLLAILFVITLGYSNLSGHVENRFLPEGCGSCHVGHGMSMQPMLDKAEEEFCYKCHGTEENRSTMISSGKLVTGAALNNIEEVFRKPFSHPVKEGVGHSPTERLPVSKGATVAHAECVDCHNPHQRIEAGEQIIHDVSGYSLSGQYKEENSYEYEICLKCHAEEIGFDQSRKSLISEFATSVKSMHPVTRPASGYNRTSLIAKAGSGVMMNCSDCHTNDDPDGPQGPHGSNYQFMLSGNYDIGGTAQESPYAYAFCYSCHDRTSILSDESFAYHRQHIVGDPLENIPGTSCYTCHASHSSQNNFFLIDFNMKVVSPDKTTGLTKFLSHGNKSGECYLNCHGQAHSPARY